jgi:hypothetical protein
LPVSSSYKTVHSQKIHYMLVAVVAVVAVVEADRCSSQRSLSWM